MFIRMIFAHGDFRDLFFEWFSSARCVFSVDSRYLKIDIRVKMPINNDLRSSFIYKVVTDSSPHLTSSSLTIIRHPNVISCWIVVDGNIHEVSH